MPDLGKQILIGLLLGMVVAIPAAWYFNQNAPVPKSSVRLKAGERTITDIVSTKTVLGENTNETVQKEVAGFFPYWNLDQVTQVDLSQLTTVYYFAIDLNGDGSINTSDPGWGKLQSSRYYLLKDLVRRSGKRWGVTIVNLDQDAIAKNINNLQRRQTIIKNTVKLMKDEDFTALNIDLEYVGDQNAQLTADFSRFVSDLTTAVHSQIPSSIVSLDAFADSVKKPRIFDMKALGRMVDQVVIMAYDIHRLNSNEAGPIAPLYGKEKYEYDITTSVSDYLGRVPAEKIILGVPFYGYEWPTESDQKGAFTISSAHGAEISSYKRSLETAAKNKATINFDDESKSVWFSYFDKDFGTWRQVWFENERSLGLKFDLVNQAKLGGVAIFALGYDGAGARPLWEEVKLKLK